jgi:hypothetical protein
VLDPECIIWESFRANQPCTNRARAFSMWLMANTESVAFVAIVVAMVALALLAL